MSHHHRPLPVPCLAVTDDLNDNDAESDHRQQNSNEHSEDGKEITNNTSHQNEEVKTETETDDGEGPPATTFTPKIEEQEQEQEQDETESFRKKQNKFKKRVPPARTIDLPSSSIVEPCEQIIHEATWHRPIGTTIIPIPRHLLLTDKRLVLWHDCCCSLVFKKVVEDPRKISRVQIVKEHGIDWSLIWYYVVVWSAVLFFAILTRSLEILSEIVSFSSIFAALKIIARFLLSVYSPDLSMGFFGDQLDPILFQGTSVSLLECFTHSGPCSMDLTKSLKEMKAIEFALRQFQDREKQLLLKKSSAKPASSLSNDQQKDDDEKESIVVEMEEESSINEPHPSYDDEDDERRSLLLLPDEKILLYYPSCRRSHLLITTKRLIVTSGIPPCGLPFFDQTITTESIENFTFAEYTSEPLREDWFKVGLFWILFTFVLASTLAQIKVTVILVIGTIVCIGSGIAGLVFLFSRRNGVLFRSSVVIKHPIFFRIKKLEDVKKIEKALRQL